MPWRLSPAKKIIIKKKKATLHFKEYCTKVNDISLVVIRFFFSQTNLILKSNPVFIDILDGFCRVFLHFYLAIFTLILRVLKFIQCLFAFFAKNRKVLMRFKALYERFLSSKCSNVLFSMKNTCTILLTCTCRARSAQFSAC